MTPDYQPVGFVEVALASLLLVVNGLVSVALQLKLERALCIAAIRTVVQLTLIGLTLEMVFREESLLVTAVLMSLMTVVAGISSVRRTSYRYHSIYLDSTWSIWLSSWSVLAITLTTILPLAPWYQPQYAIPLLGMLLGNALNGISLGLDRIQTALIDQRDEIECLLSLGATRWEAARDCVRTSIRTGMIPIINSMSVVGIVSLPGMMTGQLLSGVEPIHAIRYQMIVMFLIASTTALGTISIVLMTFRRAFTNHHQLASDRLKPTT